MVECKACNQDMSKVDSCNKKFVNISGKKYLRDTTEYDIGDRCHDCGIKNHNGNIHHNGCDMERCPKCKGQLISCDCDIGYIE